LGLGICPNPEKSYLGRHHYQPLFQTLEKIVHGISYLTTAIFFALAAWQTTLWGNIVWRSGERSETLRIIFFPFVYVVALGFAFLTFILVIDFLTLFEKEPPSTVENL